MLHSICQQIWTGKGQFSFQSQRKAVLKNAQTNAQNSPSQASAICEPWTSRCSSWFQKRQRNQRSIANIRWIMEKAREFQKGIYFCFIDYTKAFDSVDHNKLENYLTDGNIKPPDLPLEKPVCRSGRNSSNWTWNNRLVLNRKRNKSRLYIVTLLI